MRYWLKQPSCSQAGSHYKPRTFWPTEAASDAGPAAVALAMRAPRCSSIRVLTTQMGLVTQHTYTQDAMQQSTHISTNLHGIMLPLSHVCSRTMCRTGAGSIDECRRALPFSYPKAQRA